MYIDKLAIYKYESPTEKGHTKYKKLVLDNHLVNEVSMNIKQLPGLLDSLADAWSCHYSDIQVQVRFVPQGTQMEQQ
jgi:hypothetical protein|tara:strand:- start:48 stop:278 length:231 start_codon:yes stop_codon:yes gene_type:complete